MPLRYQSENRSQIDIAIYSSELRAGNRNWEGVPVSW